MEDSMHYVKGELSVGVGLVGESIITGNLRADKDLSEHFARLLIGVVHREGDAIGDGRVLKKLIMKGANFFLSYKKNRDKATPYLIDI
jgi:hypothetical protein